MIAYYITRELAEKAASSYKLKVKTDVLRVKWCMKGFYIEQDIA